MKDYKRWRKRVSSDCQMHPLCSTTSGLSFLHPVVAFFKQPQMIQYVALVCEKSSVSSPEIGLVEFLKHMMDSVDNIWPNLFAWAESCRWCRMRRSSYNQEQQQSWWGAQISGHPRVLDLAFNHPFHTISWCILPPDIQMCLEAFATSVDHHHARRAVG